MFESIGDGEKRRSRLARLITIFAVIFGVSTGLCGLTALIGSSGNTGGGLIIFGMLESAGMAVGLGGMVVVGLIALVSKLMGGNKRED